MPCKIHCIDAEMCKVVESKMSNIDEQNIDPNIFDGAFDLTVNYLSTKFYPNFLTSDIFVDYVRVSNNLYQFVLRTFLTGGGGVSIFTTFKMSNIFHCQKMFFFKSRNKCEFILWIVYIDHPFGSHF